MTILYPGQEWRGKILNTLDEKLADGSKKQELSYLYRQCLKNSFNMGQNI